MFNTPRPVDKILAGISTLVAELRDNARVNADKALSLRAIADTHQAESDRAGRAADNFAALIE